MHNTSSSMETLIQAAVFTAGLVILGLGAETMVRGSSTLALKLGVRPIVVGLTVVAFGTSAPELVVSVIASLADSPQVAIGNVIGSNIANVGLIVGLVALVSPITGGRSFLRMDMPALFLAFALLTVLSLDRTIGRLDGGIMFASLIGFVVFTYVTAGRRGSVEGEIPSEMSSTGKAIFLTLAGLVGLTVGARMMVWAAIEIATKLGVSEMVIGATIVAIGTSLPELATSVVAVLKRQHDIGLGNVIGSNIFNICSILGIAPLIRPIPLERTTLFVHYPLMVGFSVVLLLMMLKRSNRISRPEGAILLAGFIAFLVFSFMFDQ